MQLKKGERVSYTWDTCMLKDVSCQKQNTQMKLTFNVLSQWFLILEVPIKRQEACAHHQIADFMISRVLFDEAVKFSPDMFDTWMAILKNRSILEFLYG